MKAEYIALLDLCKAVGVEPPVSVRADQQQASAIIAKCIAAIPQPGPTPEETHGWPDNIRSLDDYTYALHYAETDEAYANQYFGKVQLAPQPTGCTAIAVNGMLIRNLDWFYSRQLEMLVEVDAAEGNLKYTGVAGGFTQLVQGSFPGEDVNMLRVLPFQLQDGHNSAGVKACYNVVPLEPGETLEEIKGTESVDRVYALSLIAYILRRAETAQAAYELLQHIDIWFPKTLEDMGYGLQLMITDSSNTYVVALLNGQFLPGAPYGISCMTNFRQNDVTFREDGGIITPATQVEGITPITANNIQPHGQGLERYMVVHAAYDNITDVTYAKSVLRHLFFSEAYLPTAADPWYTEFTGGNLQVDSAPADFTEIMTAAQAAWVARDRDNPQVWHTTHSSIYANGTLYLATQEVDTYKEFSL